MECLSMTADRLKENPKSPLLDLCSVTDLEAGGSAGANGGNTNSTSSTAKTSFEIPAKK